MGKCDCSDCCALFKIEAIAKSSKTRNRLQDNFCNNNSEQCARHLICVKLGKDFVPDLMLPNQMDWAKHILSDNCVSADK